METREITKQAKQNLTIFKKQLHECQCKENRLAEYYRKEWLTKGEFIKKMRKLEEKRAGFAKKYLTKNIVNLKILEEKHHQNKKIMLGMQL